MSRNFFNIYGRVSSGRTFLTLESLQNAGLYSFLVTPDAFFVLLTSRDRKKVRLMREELFIAATMQEATGTDLLPRMFHNAKCYYKWIKHTMFHLLTNKKNFSIGKLLWSQAASHHPITAHTVMCYSSNIKICVRYKLKVETILMYREKGKPVYFMCTLTLYVCLLYDAIWSVLYMPMYSCTHVLMYILL